MDEDEELASQVRQLGEPAIKALHRYLSAPREAQTDVLRQLLVRPEHDDLMQLLAIANGKNDPDDSRWAPDISRVISNKFRGTYLGQPARLITVHVQFFDRIPWARIGFMNVEFDTKGSKNPDYSLDFFKANFVQEGFACWLNEGYGISPGDIVLDETEVKAYGKSPRSVWCAFPRAAMQITKQVKWKVVVVRNDGDLAHLRGDKAPNSGFFSHL